MRPIVFVSSVMSAIKRVGLTAGALSGLLCSFVVAAQTRYDPIPNQYESEGGTGHIEITGVHVVDVLLTMIIYFGIVVFGIWFLVQFFAAAFGHDGGVNPSERSTSKTVSENSRGQNHGGKGQDDNSIQQRTLTWADGSTYVGGCKGKYRHGYGTMTYADGVMYVGEYKDHKRHGKGTVTFPDGRRMAGRWENNLFLGP